MHSFQYLADGHHVDDAGNLIACTYVDFRGPAERFPITALKKASSKRHAIPGCETMRISKPSCFLGQGEGVASYGEDGRNSAAGSNGNDPDDPTAVPERPAASGDEVHCGHNGWIYCASIEPETPEELAAWRKTPPAGYDAVSPIRRPREFARALGAMAAEKAGPRSRIVLLRNTVDGQTFCTAHKSQAVYHGPVVYLDDPGRRLECASSDLELTLLLVFVKHAAHRAQREYRFLLWAEDDPAENVVDLAVSPALVDAMWKPRQEPEGSGFVRPGPDEYSAVEDLVGFGTSVERARVEAQPALLAAGSPMAAPRSYDGEDLPGELHETATAGAVTEALRGVVDRADVRELDSRRRERAAYHRSRYGGGDRKDARDAAARVAPAPAGRPEPLSRHLRRELGGDALAVDGHRVEGRDAGRVDHGHRAGLPDADRDRGNDLGGWS